MQLEIRLHPVNQARSSSIAVAVLVALMSSACATSVDEAKQTAVALRGYSFVPPPRTVGDITALLEQEQPDPKVLRSRIATADGSPPDTVNRGTLAEFYFRRGVAARGIGRTTQELQDFRTAAMHADVAHPTGRGTPVDVARLDDILYRLADTLREAGNVSEALTHLQRAMKEVPATNRGALTKMAAFEARLYALSGDLRSADRAAAETVAYYREMLSSCREACLPVWVAGGRANSASAQGYVAEVKGQYTTAERFLLEAIAALQEDATLNRSAALDREISALARVLAREGRLVEAEIEARRALVGALRRGGRFTAHTAEMLTTLAGIIDDQGRHGEGEALARSAVDIYERIGASSDSLRLALAREQLGASLAGQRRWVESLQEYEGIRVGMASDREGFRRFFGANLTWAMVLLKTENVDQARTVVESGLERARKALGAQHPSAAEPRGLRAAVLLAARGDRSEALRECRAVTPVLAQRAIQSGETGGGIREQRVRYILEVCMTLLYDLQGTPFVAGVDVIEDTFYLADAARGRSVQRALDASAARAAAKTPELTSLVRQEQDLAQQQGGLMGLLANVSSDPHPASPANVEGIRSAVEALTASRQTLRAQIGRDYPAYVQYVDPPPATIPQVRAVLSDDEALIATYVMEDRTFVWVVRRTGPVVFASVDMREAELARRVAHVREAVDPGRIRRLADIPEFDVRAAHELYRALLDPVRPSWETARTLLTVSHGPLAQLPIALLPTGGVDYKPGSGLLFSQYRDVPWLVRSRAVVVLPAVASLTTLRGLRAGEFTRRPFIGFGDPYFNREQASRTVGEPVTIPPPEEGPTRGGQLALRDVAISPGAEVGTSRLAMLPRLPDTAGEILGIARALGADERRDVFLGVAANEQTVKKMDFTRYRVVAFATHGLVPGDLDGLAQAALALTAPEVAGIEGDGLLTVEKILGLQLDADWVVLSACNTASGNGVGSEAISGLGRAFFYAGARALLVSNWPVETTSARALTTELFRRQKVSPRLSRAEALRETMNMLIDEGVKFEPETNRPAFSYAHPIFWAPFTLVGDGGGGATP